MSLIALSGTLCADNGELMVDAPTTVPFNCSYDNPLGPTEYAWYLDGVRQTQHTSYSASILLETGSHVVRCDAAIEDAASADCSCEGTKSMSVAAIGASLIRDVMWVSHQQGGPKK